ncbi:hypothetical protein F5887DRAFT_1074331 [Amanita rubescens]|nr:hypothetical protein F5887DRAFT_1074331 [Amanita rubescens]
MSTETRATTICLFCVSPLEELRRTVTEGNGLLNTFEGLGGALRALSLTSLSRAPIGQNCLLCPVTPKIVSILDRICNLEEQVDRLTSNRDAMMGDLFNDCNLVKEELQTILEKVTNPPSPPSSARLKEGILLMFLAIPTPSTKRVYAFALYWLQL